MMTFTQIELAEYTESIVTKTVEVTSLAFMGLVLFYQLTSLAIWLYQKRVDRD